MAHLVLPLADQPLPERGTRGVKQSASEVSHPRIIGFDTDMIADLRMCAHLRFAGTPSSWTDEILKANDQSVSLKPAEKVFEPETNGINLTFRIAMNRKREPTLNIGQGHVTLVQPVTFILH
jgi:hypothetical protein